MSTATETHDEDLCRRIADILGEQSAASQALRDLERRRLSDKTARILCQRGIWLVISEKP
jgi:hypothetical protein